MSVNQILVFLSPRQFNEIYSCQNKNEVSTFLSDLIDFSEYYKNFITVVIPVDLIPSLSYDPELRMNLERIQEDSQLGILLSDSPKKKPLCERDSVGEMLPEEVRSEISARSVVNHLEKRRAPVFIDRLNDLARKSECITCAGSFSCAVKLEVQPLNSKSRSLSEPLIEYNIVLDEVVGGKRNYSASLFFDYAVFQALILGIEAEYIGRFKSAVVTDSFLADISSLKRSEFKMICISALRGVVLPSCDDKDPHSNSIDWHRNDPSKLKGYFLYRCDVVAAHENGYKNGKSGPKRILIAMKDNKKYFIAYRKDHEFTLKLIKDRLSGLS